MKVFPNSLEASIENGNKMKKNRQMLNNWDDEGFISGMTFLRCLDEND